MKLFNLNIYPKQNMMKNFTLLFTTIIMSLATKAQSAQGTN